MSNVVHCTVCGKRIHDYERNCSYCARSLCGNCCVNGLCPEHQHTMTAEQSQKISSQRSVSTVITIFSCIIGVSSLFFGLATLIASDKLIFGIICMVIFVVVVIVSILLQKKINRRTREIHAEIEEDQKRLVGVCPNCGGPIMSYNTSCSNCGMAIRQAPPPQQRPQQPVPTNNTSNHAQTIPPPPPGWTPNQNINAGLQEFKDANPGAEIKITGFYDGETNSGFHVCESCNRKFETTGETRECPHCRTPLYR